MAILAIVAACTGKDDGLTKADYRNLVERTPPASASQAGQNTPPPIPELQPILAAPPPPELEQRLVSVNVPDDQVPLKDVLIELARKVGVDLDLDSRVQGGVIIYAKDRPFKEVIDRICDMANLRYSFKDNVLRIELDTMYEQAYQLNILNTVRTAKMDVATSTDVFSAVQGGGGGGGQNNSSSSISGQSSADPWADIDANLKQILTNSNPNAQPIRSNVVNTSASAAAATPATATPATPAMPTPGAAAGAPKAAVVPMPVPVAPGTTPSTPAGAAPQAPSSNFGATVSGGYQGAANQAAPSTDQNGTTVTAPSTGEPSTGSTASSAATSAAAALTNPLAALQQQLINQATGETPTTAAEKAVAGAAAPLQAAAGGAPTSYYSINKTAGIVSVFGTSKQQRLVQAYLKRVIEQASSQVLIEAKVVEVDLNDEYKSGIDWNKAFNTAIGAINIGSTSGGTSAGFLGNQASFAETALATATSNPFSIQVSGSSFSGVLNFVEGFGTTRTLSSPRLTVLNNQTAVLKVAQNEVYFRLTATITAATTVSGPTATFSSNLQTVPIGVVMTVQPMIDAEKGTVTLALRPTVSVHSGNVSDPAVALSLASNCGTSTVGACSTANIASAITSSNVPVVDVREMDSVVTVPSGDIVIMGGLMQSTNQKQDVGVPGAADAPLVGNLFKAQTQENDVTELVVFLKATIVHGRDSVDWADKDLYKRYMQDPSPLAF